MLRKIISIDHRNVLLFSFFTKDWYTNCSGHLIFQKNWRYRSIRTIQIATDCSVFDRFCFLCVVCLFWWFYDFLWWVFAIEKLEYSRYNARTKCELVCYSTYSSDLLSYTNGSHEGFVELCDWSFQVLGEIAMDEGIRIRKRLSLGMPKASQDNIQRSSKQLSLGMPPSGIPAFF